MNWTSERARWTTTSKKNCNSFLESFIRLTKGNAIKSYDRCADEVNGARNREKLQLEKNLDGIRIDLMEFATAKCTKNAATLSRLLALISHCNFTDLQKVKRKSFQSKRQWIYCSIVKSRCCYRRTENRSIRTHRRRPTSSPSLDAWWSKCTLRNDTHK